MALSEIDRNLLERCLSSQTGAWEDFVDRFLGLVVHVVNHSAQARSMRLEPHDREDLCAEVFLAFLRDDKEVLRRFRGQSSLATYLTVVARRTVVRSLLKHLSAARLTTANGVEQASDSDQDLQRRLADRDELERLIEALDGDEAEAVRMFHLDGRSYREIGAAVGIPENSVGPLLSRAREKLRRTAAGHAAG